MKKKSPRGIPDFSSKGPRSTLPAAAQDKNKPRPAVTAPKVKPQATSQKSGRRGA